MRARRFSFPQSRAGAEEALRAVWGFPAFRPAQADVIDAYLKGDDVLAVLPTGGGKSLLYQVPALLGEGLVVVVSPLIALMQDQVANLRARGVPAVALNSTMPRRQIEQALTDARYGKYKLLYLAPERLTTEAFTALAPALPVKLLAVDEAHCVSEWAPHFRPDYRQIAEAREALGGPPLLAVTATATPDVRADIVSLLRMKHPRVIVRGFDRPNLTFSVLREDNKRARVRDILQRLGGCGIVYASTRRDVEAWAEWLRGQQVSAAHYHGGLDAGTRHEALDSWLSGQARVMVATNAFGMGIDKPDVRFVVHVSVPASIEAYYQEAGRGGRDGEEAHAVMLWQPKDFETQQTLLSSGHPTAPQLAAVFDAIGNLAQVPQGSLPQQAVRVRLSLVASLAGVPELLVRNAVDVLVRAGVFARDDLYGDGAFRWNASRDVVRKAAAGEGALGRFIERLVRYLPAEAFAAPVDVSLGSTARAIRMPAERLARGFEYLSARGLAAWQPHDDTLRLHFRVPRSNRLVVRDHWLEIAREAAQRRLADMERFVDTPVCRRRFLLGYFGEPAGDYCGGCDVCRKRREPDGPARNDGQLMQSVLHGISQTGTVNPDAADASRVTALLSWLVREEYVRLLDPLAGRYDLTDEGRRYLERLSAAV